MNTIDNNQSPLNAKLLTANGLVDGHVVQRNQPVVVPVILNEPILFITTAGGAPILDRENYVTCTYRIVNEQGFGATLFEQPGRIRGRGNSTWSMPKKPYKIKLDNSVGILGMPASKDFALLANYIDPVKIRNSLASEVSNRTGLPWAPRNQSVEVYLNGDYKGLYLLTESVEVEASRVNIAKIKATDVSGLAITGGYVLEVDTRLEENNEIGWRTRLNVPIIFDIPDGDVTPQFNYAKNFTQQCEDALFAEDFTNGAYTNLMDVNSWADWYLVSELLANNDSGFGASVKMYKPRDTATTIGKLHLGPIWDFDASVGVTFFIEHPTNRWWTRVGASWIARMLEDPAFKALVVSRWASLRLKLLDQSNSIYDWIANMQESLSGAVRRDSEIWSNGYAPNVTAWLQDRIAWMDGEFTNGYADTTPPVSPVGFDTTNITATSVSFSWSDIGAASGAGVVGYRIRCNGSIAAITNYPYSTPINVAIVSGLMTGTTYSFTIESRDGTGNWSVASAPLVVTTA